jgi:hypothetical protein
LKGGVFKNNIMGISRFARNDSFLANVILSDRRKRRISFQDWRTDQFKIGIGGNLTAPPSHTTGHAGPHPAVQQTSGLLLAL